MLVILISDKSQLKGNIEQIGFQIAIKTVPVGGTLPSDGDGIVVDDNDDDDDDEWRFS